MLAASHKTLVIIFEYDHVDKKMKAPVTLNVKSFWRKHVLQFFKQYYIIMVFVDLIYKYKEPQVKCKNIMVIITHKITEGNYDLKKLPKTCTSARSNLFS